MMPSNSLPYHVSIRRKFKTQPRRVKTVSEPNTVQWPENSLKVPVIDNWWQTETVWAQEGIASEIVQMVRTRIGTVVAFKTARGVDRLPKTQSGRILRGTIQKIADNQKYNVPATPDDPSILAKIENALAGAGFAKARLSG